MERLRVGLIGCGGAARGHAVNLLGLEEVEIVGLADPSEVNLEVMRRHYPPLARVPAFTTAEELYQAVELDAVEIVTPHTLHHPQLMAAIERGLHVLCEKPLVCTPEHGREVAQAAEAAGVVVMVSYQRRFDPAYNYMRRAVQEGELGDVEMITVTCGQNWRKVTTGSWRQDPLLSGGGMLMDSGSHMADMLLWLVDQPVRSVAALVDDLGAPVDINSVATIRFAGGTQGQLTINGNLPGPWIESVLIVGSAGILRYETEPHDPWRTGPLFHYRDGGRLQPLDLATGPTPDAAWLQAIQGRVPNPAPPEAGLRVAELTAAIYQAAQGGVVVALDRQ